MASVLNLADFNSKLERFASNLVEEEFDRFLRMLSLEILRRLVLKTPVDTGRARGNWQVDEGQPPEGELATTDLNGSATIDRGSAQLQNLPNFPHVWIVNNVPYIERLEHGWSGQAPAGMMGVTMREVEAMF